VVTSVAATALRNVTRPNTSIRWATRWSPRSSPMSAGPGAMPTRRTCRCRGLRSGSWG